MRVWVVPARKCRDPSRRRDSAHRFNQLCLKGSTEGGLVCRANQVPPADADYNTALRGVSQRLFFAGRADEIKKRRAVCPDRAAARARLFFLREEQHARPDLLRRRADADAQQPARLVVHAHVRPFRQIGRGPRADAHGRAVPRTPRLVAL